MNTRVVHLKRKGGRVVTDCDIYIGRRIARGGWMLPQSKWHNPFPITGTTTRAESIRLYEEYVKATPALMAALHELRGKRLGCWCKPLACHGDVLARLADETHNH